MFNEYEGQMTPPDKLYDPISYMEWFEDNVCAECRGNGKYRTYNHVLGIYFEFDMPCTVCEGSGTTPWLYMRR